MHSVSIIHHPDKGWSIAALVHPRTGQFIDIGQWGKVQVVAIIYNTSGNTIRVRDSNSQIHEFALILEE